MSREIVLMQPQIRMRLAETRDIRNFRPAIFEYLIDNSNQFHNKSYLCTGTHFIQILYTVPPATVF